MEKSPEHNSLDSFTPTNGFGRVLDHPSDEMMAELDLELNPRKKIDILHSQTIDNGSQNLEKEDSFPVEFSVPEEIIDYISTLRPDTTNPDRMRDISYMVNNFLLPKLQKSKSRSEAEEVVERLKATGCVNDAQYLEIKNMLGAEKTPATSDVVADTELVKDEVDQDLDLKMRDETENPIVTQEQPVLAEEVEPIEESRPEEVLDLVKKEKYTVPADLVSFIGSLISESPTRKKLKVLEWDLEEGFVYSEDQLQKILRKSNLDRVISDDEYQKCLSFLHKQETPESEVVEEDIPKAVEIATVDSTDSKVVALEKTTPEEVVEEKPIVLEGEVLPAETVDEVKKKKELLDIDAEVVKVESVETVDNDLSEARSRYAEELNKWKADLRNKRGFLEKTLSVFGVEKPSLDTDKSVELVSAERDYIEAKRRKYRAMGLFDKAKELEIQDKKYNRILYRGKINEEIMAETEKERDILQRKIVEMMPKIEKGMFAKAVGKFNSLPMSQRIGMMVATGIVAGLASGVTLTGAAVYGGGRLARTVGGMASSQIVGKGIDGIFKKYNKKKDAEDLKVYGLDMDDESFFEKEKELMKDIERSDARVKKQNRLKAFAMLGTAGLASAGLGSLDASLSDIDTPKGPKIMPEKPGIPNIPTKEVLTPEIKVELSPKGFIQDIQNLKAKVIEHYGGADNVPENVKTGILDQPSIQLAKDFGLYDPENNASGLGFKGESLVVDDSGNIVIEHLNGDKELLYDGKTTEVRQFSGEMVNQDLPEEAPVSDEVLSTESEDSPVPEESPVPTEESPASETKTEENIDTKVDPINNRWGVSFEDRGGMRALNFETEGLSKTIAVEQKTDLGKILVLDSRFQDGGGVNKLAREAYSTVFDHENALNPISDIPPIPFEDGRITIIQGVGTEPNEIRVLLNGKQFAEGYINSKETSLEIMNEKGMQGGWLLAETPYERAYKFVQPIIKTLKMKSE